MLLLQKKIGFIGLIDDQEVNMLRLLYEYIYVNLWLLLFLALMWANDGYISIFESCLLIAISITGIVFVSKKQLRSPENRRFRDI